MSWPEADQRAALEWQAWTDSLCDGCKRPVSECFDPKMDDRYDVEVVVCHACAARERKAEQMNSGDGPRLHAARYVVTPEED